MSYRRSYQGVIHYSGSVSYPASQNGGTAHYSGSEPVYITIDVDTESFDRNVDGCKLAVDGLGAAVVATEEAEVQSKREYSRRIGETLIGGFFNYREGHIDHLVVSDTHHDVALSLLDGLDGANSSDRCQDTVAR